MKKRNKADHSKDMKNDKVNPFEVHINHSKHKILGQKSKDDHGLPGISRGKAYHKREKTLLGEYRDRFKASQFLDLRIGEKNKFLDPEKKIMLRLAAEKKKEFSKKSLYHLNDDEQLMHGGQLLTEDVMKDKRIFSDDDDDDDVLDGSFVKEQHFGGGMFTKPQHYQEDEGGNLKAKSRKEWIDDIIAESKKKKAETKKEKEVQNDAVSKLDAQFQNFLSLMRGKNLTEEDKEKSKRTCQFREYDMYVNEFSFDRTKRAKPTDRMKTEEELIKEEEAKLRKLEAERIRRMKSESDSLAFAGHTSADALDDGFDYGTRSYVQEPLACHSSRKKVNLKKESTGTNVKNESSKNKYGYSDEESDNVEKDDDGEEEEEVEIGGEEEEETEGEEEEETEGEEGKGSDDDSSSEEDNFSDVLECTDGEEEDESSETELNDLNKESNSDNESDLDADYGPSTSGPMSKKSDKADGKPADDLPFTFDVPIEYDEFWELICGRSPSDVFSIVARMITCNHPSLGSDNKSKTNFIFAYILQTLHIVCSVEPETIKEGVHPLSYINCFIPHLYTITQLNPIDSASALTQVIDEKYEEYSSNRVKKFPFADTYIFLKISGVLFPASDFHHDVMTRVLTFLTQLLGEASVTSGRDVAALLFTTSLLFEYLSRSGRFVGEILNAMCGLLFVSIPSNPLKRRLPNFPPFRSTGPTSNILVQDKPVHGLEEENLSFSQLNQEIEITSNFKIKILNETLKLLNKMCFKWVNLPAVRALFMPVSKLMENFRLENYPDDTGLLVEEVQETISSLPPQVYHLKRVEGQLKTLKMVEPSIEKVFDGTKKRFGSREFQEKQKLIHKLKRERKGAKRELKKDKEFLARQQLKDVLASDAERKRKVNLIMQGLATQESEYKKLKLKK